jgi:hypothetical protein
MEVSTVRGRRFVGGMGSGRSGGAGAVSPVSCSHRAQWGLCVRPSNAWGSVERLRLGVMDLVGVSAAIRRTTTVSQHGSVRRALRIGGQIAPRQAIGLGVLLRVGHPCQCAQGSTGGGEHGSGNARGGNPLGDASLITVAVVYFVIHRTREPPAGTPATFGAAAPNHPTMPGVSE